MATRAAILDIRTEGFKQSWISMSFWCLPSGFGSIWLMVWEEILFEEFQGSHLGYWNRTILAIQNLYVAPMPPIKFRLNPTYGLGGDVLWRISRWLPWWPSWILEPNNFCNSESLCCSDASHQVSAQSNLRSFKGFQDGLDGGHLGYWNGMILAILNLYIPPMPPIRFLLNPIYDFGGDVTLVVILDIVTEGF